MDGQTVSFVRYRHKWLSVREVLHQQGNRTGWIRVPPGSGSYMRVALELLCRYYSKQEWRFDDAGFHSIPLHMPAKIMWVDGEAAAYYTYQMPGD